MFNIYADIANHLKEKLPELRTIDADKGQLANPEQAFPMDFPAVLIDLDVVDWAEMGKKLQKGGANIGITVAVLPTAQSSQSSPTLDDYVTEMDIIDKVFGVLSGFLGLTRTKTVRQKRWDTIQTYTHLFKTGLTDRSAQKTYTTVEVPVKVDKVELKK